MGKRDEDPPSYSYLSSYSRSSFVFPNFAVDQCNEVLSINTDLCMIPEKRNCIGGLGPSWSRMELYQTPTYSPFSVYKSPSEFWAELYQSKGLCNRYTGGINPKGEEGAKEQRKKMEKKAMKKYKSTLQLAKEYEHEKHEKHRKTLNRAKKALDDTVKAVNRVKKEDPTIDTKASWDGRKRIEENKKKLKKAKIEVGKDKKYPGMNKSMQKRFGNMVVCSHTPVGKKK
jgi:hypothetical protein